MAINFGPIIAGPYTGAYNAIDVGFTLEGFKLALESVAEELDQSDLFGRTLFDMVYLGGKARLSYISRTYKPGAISPFWPWAALGEILTTAKPISRLARNEAKAFVLTSTPNTPAAASPATLTANLSILAPGSQELMFDAKARSVPVVLQLLPYETSAGTAAVFTTT